LQELLLQQLNLLQSGARMQPRDTEESTRLRRAVLRTAENFLSARLEAFANVECSDAVLMETLTAFYCDILISH
jgi:hypothetical protein